MNILFICNKSPYPSKEGGPIAMRMFIEGMAEKGHYIKVLTVSSDKYKMDPNSIPQKFKSTICIEDIHLNLNFNFKEALQCLIRNESYHIHRFKSLKFENKLKEIIEEDTFDIIQFESLFVAPYIDIVRTRSKAKLFIRTHNVEHQIWETIARSISNPFKKYYLQHSAKTLKRFELKILNEFDGIITITQNDKNYFLNAKINKPITSIPFGLDMVKYIKAENSDRRAIFHLGAMNWIPNIIGIDWFLKYVWPFISNQKKDVKLYLAGSNMPKHIKNTRAKNVYVEEEVDHPVDYMNLYQIMIVPLFSGSGIRIKIIEGMALGKTIISTSIGAAGIDYIDNKNIIIADTPNSFIEAIHKCINHPQLAKEIGMAARKLIEEKHNKDKLLVELENFYSSFF